MKKNRLKEGIDEMGTPDMKYYAFDWDDNVVHMPTKIILKNEDGDDIGMSTDDFAEYRHDLGKNPIQYKGETIVGFADNPFRNFRTEGDKDFLIDAMRAKEGPAFDDFREAINNGSIFSIITSRGHNPKTLKQAIYNYIIKGFNGIDKDSLVKNLKKYRTFVGEDDMSDDELIKSYLNLNKYHPVTFGEGSAANPEELKIVAMRKFITYCQEMAQEIGKRAIFKNDMTNQEFTPKIGFSDDDPRNIEKMKGFLEKEYPESSVRTYLTKGDIKTEV
jgi:hypothetical protein